MYFLIIFTTSTHKRNLSLWTYIPFDCSFYLFFCKYYLFYVLFYHYRYFNYIFLKNIYIKN
jgi:hypothetical protein